MRLICYLSLLWMFVSPAHAETPQQFIDRIEQAINQEDKGIRLKSIAALYYLAGTDEVTRGFIKRSIGMLAKLQGATVTLEPLGERKFAHVLDGYEYRPNLEPAGLVKLAGGGQIGASSQLPYAIRDGKYYLPGTVRRLIKANAPNDVTLQMIAIGLASPPLTFSGWCDVLHSDEQVRRRQIGDEGRGNTSIAFHGQRFERCEITNTAGRGRLSLRLIEGGNLVFERSVEYPETRLSYSAD